MHGLSCSVGSAPLRSGQVATTGRSPRPTDRLASAATEVAACDGRPRWRYFTSPTSTQRFSSAASIAASKTRCV